MLSCPAVGASVRVHYRVGVTLNVPGEPPVWPLHGRVGVVRVRAKGRGPRNHGIEISGQVYVVPCGNLYFAPDPKSPPRDAPNHARPAPRAA